MVCVGLKEIAQDEFTLRLAQILRRLYGTLQKWIGRRARCVLLILHDHRRYQVEGLVHGGKILQHFHHSVVILQRVKARPRQAIFTEHQVLIQRLVHVPNKAEVSARQIILRYRLNRLRIYLANMLRMGGGASVPRMARHRMSFNSSSSFKSSFVKSIRADRAAVAELAGLRSSSEMRGFSA